MSDGRADAGRAELEEIVRLALAEDLGREGDITSKAIFTGAAAGAARVFVREECVISGLTAAAEVCRQVGGIEYLPLVQDGQGLPAGAEVVRLEGSLLSILAAERTLLNFLSRLAGVATYTSRFAKAVEGLPVRVAATRKTSPGLRRLEKKAVVDGGGVRHRTGLFDAVLIKDNHIAAAGGVTPAVKAVQEALGDGMPIEVEVDTVEQLREAISAGAASVLLDNMSAGEVGTCVGIAGGEVETEASGGISLDNIRSYAEAGVDLVSVGDLTRAAPGIDFSLEVDSER